ncbi:MAG: aminotransferase class V-fold PLP-dependent enzyme [Devosia sp.]
MVGPAPHTPEVRDLWGLDYSTLIVNHGSYGATPLEVLARQDEWRRLMEANPTLFMQRDLPGAIRDAAAVVGRAVGARGDDIVLVDNATAAINAVLASLPFGEGDEILLHSHTYGAVIRTANHAASRTGARVVTFDLPFPDTTGDDLVHVLVSALTDRTRLVILDHITSASALVFPLARMVAACRTANVPVLVDGAHGPGQVPLDLEALGADYYVGNGHKWWMGAKGAGFLWTAPARQAELHPTIISWGYGNGYTAEFDWTGTRDWSAALVLPDAIAFHERLGGSALMAANARLAREAADTLAVRWGTRTVAPELQAAMSMVQLPFSGEATPERALAIRHELLGLDCDLPVQALSGALWCRLSAQAYNLSSDYERLGDMVDMFNQRLQGK